MSLIWKIILSSLVFFLLAGSARGQMMASSPFSGSPQGVLSPWKTCRVACAESGLVEEILVKPGETVLKGQPLARLEIRQQLLSVAFAEAQAQAIGKIQSARADVDLFTRRLQSVENARPNGYTSQSEWERAQMELEIARGRLLSEEEDQAVQKIHVERLLYQLEQRSVVAPFAGTVVRILKEVGEYVAPNTPEVVELVDISRLRAVFYLNLDEVATLASHPHPMIEIDGQQIAETELEFVAPVADPESGLVEVRVLVMNPTKRVMGASCVLVLTSSDGRRT